MGGSLVFESWGTGDPIPITHRIAGSHLRPLVCGDESVLELIQTFLYLLGILDEGQVLFLHLRENRQQLLGISKI